MQKILLDFCQARTPEKLQDYMASVFHFPDYYGKNLDALYDMLTELGEYSCIGVFEPEGQAENEAFLQYLHRVKQVLRDAEAENPRLCVIFAKREENKY